MSVCDCVCVCLSVSISLELLDRSLWRSPVAVAWSSSGSTVPGTSGFMDDATSGRKGPCGDPWSGVEIRGGV